jgi:hypothetical protein
MGTRRVALLLAVVLLPLAACAQTQTGRAGRTFAQRLLRDVLRRHPEIKVMELAALSGEGCVTIAATDAGDIGHNCNERERHAMLSKDPYVEDPSDDDPAYIVTEALHDASGRVVGVVITDVVVREPGGGRDAALARARAIRWGLESRILSVAQLTAGTLASWSP